MARTGPSSTIHFRLDLPEPARWNTKLLMFGGGGFDGIVPTEHPQFLPFSKLLGTDGAQIAGFARVSSDSGHQGRGKAPFADFSWVAGNPVAMRNHAYEANHAVLVSALDLSSQFYGKAPTRRYIAGVSNGGRAGLIAIQHYPYDYDQATRSFMRFYISAATGHLMAGAGSSTEPLLSTLESWVEQGRAPQPLVSTLAPDSVKPRAPEYSSLFHRSHEDAFAGLSQPLVANGIGEGARHTHVAVDQHCPRVSRIFIRTELIQQIRDVSQAQLINFLESLSGLGIVPGPQSYGQLNFGTDFGLASIKLQPEQPAQARHGRFVRALQAFDDSQRRALTPGLQHLGEERAAIREVPVELPLVTPSCLASTSTRTPSIPRSDRSRRAQSIQAAASSLAAWLVRLPFVEATFFRVAPRSIGKPSFSVIRIAYTPSTRTENNPDHSV